MIIRSSGSANINQDWCVDDVIFRIKICLFYRPLCVFYKVALFAYKSKNKLTPTYLNLLVQPRVNTPTANRAFSVAAPRILKSLPMLFKATPTLNAFKSSLKTFLLSINLNIWTILMYYLLSSYPQNICLIRQNFLVNKSVSVILYVVIRRSSTAWISKHGSRYIKKPTKYNILQNSKTIRFSPRNNLKYHPV